MFSKVSRKSVGALAVLATIIVVVIFLGAGPAPPNVSGLRDAEIVIAKELKDVVDFVSNNDVIQLLEETTTAGACKNLLACVAEITQWLTVLEHYNGVLIVATGTGDSAVVRLPIERGRDARALRDNHAIDAMLKAAAKSSTPTIFHLPTEPIDVFAHARANPKSTHAKVLSHIQKTYPILFWLHHSPSVLEQGNLPERLIPIPTSDQFLGQRYPVADWSILSHVVTWRGSTTGLPLQGQKYETTDRYKAVQIFHMPKAREICDVKFTDELQPHVVGTTRIPGDYFSQHVPHESIVDGGRVALDVDGNCNSADLSWKLSSGLAVLKINSTQNHVQWFYHQLRDGVHLIIASANNPNDLIGKAKFMTTNEALTPMIMRSAKRFGESHLTSAAVRSYVDEAVVNCHSNVAAFAKRDWRIRSLPGGYKFTFK